MARLTRPLAAEFIGTFALIFIGAGAAMTLPSSQIAAVALAHGLTIMAFAYSFGKDSGSYVNPAVTLAAAIGGEHGASDLVPVVIFQLLGGIAGGFTLLGIYGSTPHHLGATLIDLQLTSLGGAFCLEAIGTFFLCTVVLNTALRGAAGDFAPFAIGMTVALCIMAFGPVTGGSINPARTLGPAVASGTYSNIWVYFSAQITGSVVAGLLYRLFWRAAPASQDAGSSREPQAAAAE